MCYLRGDKRMLRQVIDDWLVLPAVTKRELVGVTPSSHTQELIAHADAKYGLDSCIRGGDQAPQTLNEGSASQGGVNKSTKNRE
jgi:hypothetical protein